MTIQTVLGPTKLVAGANAPVVGDAFAVQQIDRVFQAVVVDGPNAYAEVAIEVSLNGADFLNLATITLDAATGHYTDGFNSDAAWRYVRANVKAVSPGATIDVWVGV